MSFIAKKVLTLNGKRYNSGESIPDCAILESRVRALKNTGYIIESLDRSGNVNAVYTTEEFEKKLTERLQEALGSMKNAATKLNLVEGMELTGNGTDNGKIVIPVKKGKEKNGDAEYMALPMLPEEIVQVFRVLHMTASEGIAEMEKINSENVLILIQVTDSRKTVQNAAKDRVDVLTAGVQKIASNGNKEDIEDTVSSMTEPKSE